MIKQAAYRMLVVLLCLSGWPTTVVVAAETPLGERTSQSNKSASALLDRTTDRPQWQDIGMCDILAVTGGSTLTPPTTVRVVHDSPSGITPASQAAAARHYSVRSLSTYSYRRTVSGYIYLIRCLRL